MMRRACRGNEARKLSFLDYNRRYVGKSDDEIRGLARVILNAGMAFCVTTSELNIGLTDISIDSQVLLVMENVRYLRESKKVDEKS